MPTMMCTLPAAISASSILWSVAERFSCDEKSAMVHSVGMRVSTSLFQCAASTVVGASTTTCRPAQQARWMARIATSVLPQLVSP